MLKFTKTYGWVGCLACLAIAVAASGAMADEEKDKDEGQQYEAQRQSSDEDSARQDEDRQRSQQDRERSQQDMQRYQQDQQRSQQDRQRDQQATQRDQQDRQRNQQQWDEGRGFPQPDRDAYGRSQDQWNRDQQSQRSGQSGNDAGLGVSIAQERGVDGLTVIRVHRNSPADDMGLREGDRITRINGQRVRSTEQFISQVRNMDPGDEVELEVQRNREDRTFRGQLESRQEALVLRGNRSRGQRDSWQQDRGSRQTGYEEQRGYARSGRSGGSDSQIRQIERQLNQLSQEIDDLRYALRDLRNQSGRETMARYDEYRSRDGSRNEGSRLSDRSQQDRQRQYDGSRDSQRSYQDSQSPREFGQQSSQFDQGSPANSYNQYESTGGETGEARLRPDRN